LGPDTTESQPPGGDGASPARSGGRLRSLWRVPTYRFAILFVVLLAGIAAAYPQVRLRGAQHFRAAEIATADLVYQLLRVFSSEARRAEGTIVFLGHFPVAIIDECTGIYEAVLLAAALLAFPTTWSKTAVGFLLGLPLIYAMNVVRIAMLLVVGRHLPSLFEFMHVYFWQVTMIAMVSTTWLAWVVWVVRDGTGRAQSAAPSPGG
jgi:exosortase H (IPTLxxWG-CTERM-specific)